MNAFELARCAGASLTLLALVGCAGPAITPPSMPLAVPATFKAPDAAEGAATALAPLRGPWWRVFGDAVLDELEERAAGANTDIAAAATRLAQARALLSAAAARGRPQVDLSASAGRQGGPLLNDAGASGNLFTANVGVSYEPDLFARLAAARDATALDAQASAALLRSTQLVVQADVAQTYFALRAADAERRLAGEAVAALRQTLALTEMRVRSGSVAAQALGRMQAEVAEAEAEALALKSRRAELEHALAVLVGEAASSFTVAEQTTTSPPLPQVPAGLPSAMLTRRPDVSAAQHKLQAAQLRLGSARTAWWPSVALTAAGGHASSELSTLLQTGMRAWALSAVLSAPLFDGGRREAGVRQAEAEAEAAAIASRAQMLVALREVEDQLSALRLLAERARWMQRAEEAAASSSAQSASRYRNGLASQFELLDARRAELRTHRQVLQLQAARQQATVALIRALGGGWGGNGAAAPAVGQTAAGGAS